MLKTNVGTARMHAHDSPHDFGLRDYYYWREPEPRYRRDGELVLEQDMTPAEIRLYWAAYQLAVEDGDRKDFGMDEPWEYDPEESND